MLAIRRTESVRGRIIFLIVSINTIKLIRAIGVPEGVKCEKKFFQLINKDKVKIQNQAFKAIEKLKDICEVTEMMYGNKEKKLIKKIKIKREKNNFDAPKFLIDFFFITIEKISFPNSFLRILLKKEKDSSIFLLTWNCSVTENAIHIIKNKINSIGLILWIVGSNIENKFVNIYYQVHLMFFKKIKLFSWFLFEKFSLCKDMDIRIVRNRLNINQFIGYIWGKESWYPTFKWHLNIIN